jgi:hypothetical protein
MTSQQTDQIAKHKSKIDPNRITAGRFLQVLDKRSSTLLGCHHHLLSQLELWLFYCLLVCLCGWTWNIGICLPVRLVVVLSNIFSDEPLY